MYWGPKNNLKKRSVARGCYIGLTLMPSLIAQWDAVMRTWRPRAGFSALVDWQCLLLERTGKLQHSCQGFANSGWSEGGAVMKADTYK